jgi:hypothetical protein
MADGQEVGFVTPRNGETEVNMTNFSQWYFADRYNCELFSYEKAKAAFDQLADSMELTILAICDTDFNQCRRFLVSLIPVNPDSREQIGSVDWVMHQWPTETEILKDLEKAIKLEKAYQAIGMPSVVSFAPVSVGRTGDYSIGEVLKEVGHYITNMPEDDAIQVNSTMMTIAHSMQNKGTRITAIDKDEHSICLHQYNPVNGENRSILIVAFNLMPADILRDIQLESRSLHGEMEAV